MCFADLFAHRNHDALPTDHGAETQGDRHREFDPGWNELSQLIHVTLQSGGGFLLFRVLEFVSFENLSECFGREVQIAAQ